MEVHGHRTVAWLREAGLDDEVVLQAVLAHNPANGSAITSRFDRALFAADPLTGLITAAALIRPEKQLGPGRAEEPEEALQGTVVRPGRPAGGHRSPARSWVYPWTSSWPSVWRP